MPYRTGLSYYQPQPQRVFSEPIAVLEQRGNAGPRFVCGGSLTTLALLLCSPFAMRDKRARSRHRKDACPEVAHTDEVKRL